MLTGKNIILTGANRGIGLAILKVFAENHGNVWCLVRSMNDEFLSTLKKLEEQYSVRLDAISCDLSDESSIKEAFRLISTSGEKVDILINNAAQNHRGAFLMTSLSDMRKLYQTNYFAPLQLMQLSAKQMIRNRAGVIINIGSASGFEHNTGNFSYAATKASLMWATQTLSRELAPYGIRVNGVAPGVTDTEINRGNETVLEESVLTRMNIKRYGSPEEIASAVLFLATEQSSFVSGQILRVDGGRF